MKRILWILKFLRPYRWACFFVLLIVVADVLAALLVPTITANMINHALNGDSIHAIFVQGAWMLAISIVSGGFTLLGGWLCARISANFGRDLRQAIYEKSLTFSSSDFERFGTASMMTRTMNDINVLQQSLISFIQMVLPVPFMCILGIVFAFQIHESMGWLVLSATILLLLCALIIVFKATPIFEKLQRFLDRMNVVLREVLTGVRVIRAFNKEEHEKARMKKTFADYADAAIRANRLFAGLDCLANVSINFCIVAILYVGSDFIGTGAMKIGDITAVTEYAIWILFYVVMAQMVVMLMPRAMTCAQRVTDVLMLEPSIQDAKDLSISRNNLEHSATFNADSGILYQSDSATPHASSNDVIAFHHVSFRFDDADEDTLCDLNFTCRRGTTTAVIGGTGSGKSTIAKLILRFHEATKGKITLFGRDIRQIPQNDLRHAISYVPQKAWLFAGTVADNLRYAAPNADEETMQRALEIAQSQFVFELPKKLQSPVSQGGTNFSGGQRQRLAIARALTKKADLYIFDDSFSALDFKTDAALRHALNREIQDSAILIIAQRISTIVHADTIVVLDDGKIVAIGTHEQLLQSSQIYKDIANSQMKGGEHNAQ